MHPDDARKILGMLDGDSDVLRSFTKRKILITARIETAPTEALKKQFHNMLKQIEQAASVLSNEQNATLSDKPAPTGGSSETGKYGLQVGQLLAQRYTLLEQIGQGRISALWRVSDAKRNRDFVLKVISPELLADETAKNCFINEAHVSSELFHPGIVNSSDWKNDGDYYFLLMELLHGRTLRQLIDDRKKTKKSFTTKEALRIGKTIAEILSYAHISTVHRDLNPDNIWVDSQGNFKIIGFGSERLMHAVQSADTSASMNTRYRAPEQLVESNHIDGSADQFALGVILYEMLTFQLPDASMKTVSLRFGKAGRKISRAIEKLLQVNSAQRFQSTDEVVAALTLRSSAISFPRLGLKTTALLATLVISATLVWPLISSGRLAELWDSFRPRSAQSEQQQFNATIKQVSDVNELIKHLRQARNKLETRIRIGDRSIGDLEVSLRRARRESQEIEITGKLEQARFDQQHNRQLRSLTNRIIYDDNYLSRARDIAQTALSLISENRHAKATALLIPVLVELKFKLEQFGRADGYLLAVESLTKTQSVWRQHNLAQQLSIPEGIESYQQALIGVQKLAARGKLVESIAQLNKLKDIYQKLWQTDQDLAAARARHQKQQVQTEQIENEWQAYLRKHGLKISRVQQDSIQQHKVTEQTELNAQEFEAAIKTSVALQQQLIDYHAQSKLTAAANREKKLARALSKPKSADTKRLAQNTAISEASGVAKPANADTPAELIEKYAPGMQLLSIPAGSFAMGDLGRDGSNDEKPVRQVKVKQFKLTKHEITFAQFDVYFKLTSARRPGDESWGRGNRPVINVSWREANDYAKWLSAQTQSSFRLPSEAEWEYAARAGSRSKFSWGNTASHNNANYGQDNCCGGLAADADKWINTSPVGAFPANKFGLSDMHGNVWEWVQDCWNKSYNGASLDGSAWLIGDCSKRVSRGGAWSSVPGYMRSANRDGVAMTKSNNSLGFRLVLD
ncbi:MAG: formylglycine-generating enzyme required for sulfatase activity/serine/threonine protein kinase [Planctomycetota bacterium]|jgi:formylglycine-generating enzyme required for sulfatase activity/serine/threonine protein kinase